MTIQEMVDAIAIEVPGCPFVTIRDALRQAQRELCAEGNAWVADDGPVVFDADTEFAAVEPPLDAEAVRILDLVHRGRTLRPGVDYRQAGDNLVRLFISVDSSEIDGRLACRPIVGRDMPDELLARWSDAVMDGARYRLLMLPQPWRDLPLAEVFHKRFSGHVADAKCLAYTGYQAGSVRVRIPRF